MNRTTKYRAWDKKNKRMRQVVGLTIDNGHIDSVCFYGMEGKSLWNWRTGQYSKLMQFTGLKDKNGKEIYEGDIVKWGTGKETVVFENGAFGFVGVSFDYLMEETGKDFYSILEIIGNIWEDGDLLK